MAISPEVAKTRGARGAYSTMKPAPTVSRNETSELLLRSFIKAKQQVKNEIESTQKLRK